MKSSRFGFTPRIAVPILLAALALPVAAQTADEPAPAAPAGQGMTMGPGQGMGMGMGMHRMQGARCPMKMRHACGKSQHLRMPRLPPGNDKLQLQMEAEIMQKIGEIQGKYANQLP